MDVQRALNFEIGEEREAALRNALAPLGLPEWSAELIVLMTRDGRPREVAGHKCYELAISKRKAAEKLGCSPNTFSAAAAELQRRGCLEIVAFGQARTYFLSGDRVSALAPIADDPIDELGLFSGPPRTDQSANRSALVSAGQRARVLERKIYTSREREPCNRARVHGPADQLPPSGGSNAACSTDQSVSAPKRGPLAEQAASSAATRGGRLIDLSDETVRRRSLSELRPFFDDAVRAGWLEDCHEHKRKFLAICHHAGNCRGIHSPAKVVYAAVKRHDFERINQESWDWSAEVLRPKDLARA